MAAANRAVPPPPLASPSCTILDSQFTEAKWMAQMEENLKLDLEKATQSLLCIVRIPASLKQAAGHSYTPQLIGLGPFHHFRSDLYHMEPLKLAIAKSGLVRFGLSDLRDVANLLSPLLPSIQASYGLHLDLKDDTLASVVAIDGLFLIGFLDNEELIRLSSSATYFCDSSKRKLSPHAVLSDLILLENQVPLFLLAEALQPRSLLLQESASSISEQICSEMDLVCRLLSPLELPSRFPPYVRRRHLLDRLYLLMTWRDNNSNGKNKNLNSLVDVRVHTSVGILQRVAVALHLKQKEPPPLARASSDPAPALEVVVDDPKMLGPVHHDDYVPIMISTSSTSSVITSDDHDGDVHDTQRMAMLQQRTTSLPANGHRGLDKSAFAHAPINRAKCLFGKWESSITFDETVADQLKSFAQQNDKLPITGVFRVFAMLDNILKEDKRLVPSASKLKRVDVKVRRAHDAGLSNIRFDHRTKTLELPVFTWSPNAEVVMRNLLAYEAHAKSSSLLLKRYMELMHGLVRSVKDVKLLVSEGVVEVGAADPAMMLEMFRSMGSATSYPKDQTILDPTVTQVREFYNNKWKILVGRLGKKYAKVIIQVSVIIAGLALIIVLFVQAWCSVYKCSSNGVHQTLAKILPAATHSLFSYFS